MSRSGKFAALAVVAGLAAAGSASAATMPTAGHFLGYGTVSSVNGTTCVDTAGATFNTQLQLSTPTTKLVPVERRVFSDTSGPDVLKTEFKKTSGDPRTPAGTITVTDLETAAVTSGTYKAAYTPLDAATFAASITTIVTISTGVTCTETVSMIYIRTAAGS